MLRTSAVLENSQTPNKEPIQVESSNSSFLEGQHLPQDVRCKPTTVPLLRWARHTRCSAFPRNGQQYRDIENKYTCGWDTRARHGRWPPSVNRDGGAPMPQKMLELVRRRQCRETLGRAWHKDQGRPCLLQLFVDIWQCVLDRWFTHGVAAAMLRGHRHARMRKRA